MLPSHLKRLHDILPHADCPICKTPSPAKVWAELKDLEGVFLTTKTLDITQYEGNVFSNMTTFKIDLNSGLIEVVKKDDIKVLNPRVLDRLANLKLHVAYCVQDGSVNGSPLFMNHVEYVYSCTINADKFKFEGAALVERNFAHMSGGLYRRVSLKKDDAEMRIAQIGKPAHYAIPLKGLSEERAIDLVCSDKLGNLI